MTQKRSTTPHLSEHELSEIRALIEKRSGIFLDASRERFFSTRIREHLKEQRLAGGSDLLRSMQKSNVDYEAVLERLLTQETSFFRYPAVYDALEKRVLPEMHLKKFWENPRSLRVWSAGCSTGEEPYSIAVAIADALMFADAWNIEILATDISRHALKFAERGVYSRRSLGNLDSRRIAAYFTSSGDHFCVKSRIRKMVSFAPMNLAQGVYVGRMDCIFCMNVMIYFSEERRAALIQQFYEYLAPGGYLFLGHSESIARVSVKFQAIVLGDCILYRKPAASAGSRPELAAVEERM
ncbi:MAG TPA: protein-glutamate O-methyltransferase CheR [Candidatus Dormibacteraeota bacterium]|nr:protein-glutamate O-methyltransferase CheR [Candidatus Dormibacteraeota bacterium]